MSGGDEGVGIDESAEFGIVIAALEVIEVGFLIADIAPVAQRVDLTEPLRQTPRMVPAFLRVC